MTRLAPTLVLLALPSLALAERSDYETPRHFALELKAGPYLPDVDSEENLSGTPYRDIFGDGSLVFTGFEFDWQILVTEAFSAGVGAGAGFFQAYEKARFEGCFGPDADCESSDYTVLNVIPFTVLGVLRVDVLPNTTGIPITPFVKAGLDRYMWWILDGGGTAEADGKKGSGWTWGWHVAGGIMLLLDVFEPSSATHLDQESGINSSYAFFEVYRAQIDGFGSSSSLVLSDTTWNAGLALEF